MVRQRRFHPPLQKIEGDFVLSAGIQFAEPGGNPHRKGCLTIRQTLDADSPYLDIAVHGDGLTSLQFRETKGGPTREVRGAALAPARVQLLKRGDQFLMYSGSGTNLACSGATFSLRFEEPFYLGLGACAHDNKAVAGVVFSNVELSQKTPALDKSKVECSLEIVPIGSKDRRVLYHSAALIEAPNWAPDGQTLIFNSKGRLLRIGAKGGNVEVINTGFATRCNNDHGISPDGRRLAISDQTKTGKSMIYVLPISGGEPVQITFKSPSYWHGWSPDGQTLAYCAERNGNFDIYTIPAAGGEERRLTDAAGLDDGPDYSPDGKYIYFNSERSGRMQIWRMKTDGSDQEQVTQGDSNTWFPHPSPDGKWLACLAYEKEVEGHPANKNVELRLISLADGSVQVLAKLFGGQGTINVPSWSPDSKELAFVSYHYP